jgi:hypothetical protein
MSYSFNLKVKDGSEDVYGEVVNAGTAAVESLGEDSPKPEMFEHVYAAADAVAAIFATHCFGEGRTVNVSVSGHAEPNHTKREGWSQDCMIINLSQLQED